MFENGQIILGSSQIFEKNDEIAVKDDLILESKYKKKKKMITISGDSYKTGRWTHEEHQKFVEAIFIYGNDWKIVQKHIGTRTSTQARSHAQKFLIRLKKKLQIKSENDKITLNSLDKLSNDSVQSCIKEFISNSNGNSSLRQIDREKLFKVILSFSNLLYFKSKKKDKKNVRFPILEADYASRIEKLKISDHLQKDKIYLSNKNQIFQIDKVKKDQKFSNYREEITFLVEEKNIMSTSERSRKKRIKNCLNGRNHSKKTSHPYESSKTHFKIDPNIKFENKTKNENEEFKKIYDRPSNINNINIPISLNNNNNCINIFNISVCNSNYANSTNQIKSREFGKSNCNIYDDLLQYYGNNRKLGQLASSTQDEYFNEYMRNFPKNILENGSITTGKLSNASTLTNTNSVNRKEDKSPCELDENNNLDEMKIIMPMDNNFEDVNSLYLANNFFYNHNNYVNKNNEEECIIDKFFDFK